MTITQIEACLLTEASGELTLPINRKVLPFLFAARGYAAGAEIGVWHGAFSVKLRQANPALQLLCVDAWEAFHGYADIKGAALKTDAQMREAEVAARQLLEPMDCEIRKGDSLAIAQTIPDRSLDFVYIDANHTYEAVTADLEAWSPKVKSGGVIAGHDYSVQPQKPFIQVIRAVKDFVSKAGIPRWFITTEKNPSFLWVNP